MKIKFAVLMLILMISNFSMAKEYGHITKKDSSGAMIFSYVQWNNEYAVTVKHTPKLVTSVYKSDVVDVQFFKIKSKEVPVWVEPKRLESLKMVGFIGVNPLKKKETVGNDAGMMIQWKTEKPYYRLMNNLISEGMSGGPVFNTKNEVVGINIGYVKQKYAINGKEDFYSIYLPLNVIKDEWNKYQKLNM